MKIHFTSPSRPKRIAKELRRQIAAVGIEISLPASQDLTAQMHGYAHWRDLNANVGAGGSAGSDNIPEKTRQEQVLVARFPALSGKTAKILEAVAYPAVEGAQPVLSDSREQAKIFTWDAGRYREEMEGIVYVGISLRKSQLGFPDECAVPMTFGIIVNGPALRIQTFRANSIIERDSQLDLIVGDPCSTYPDLWGVLWRLGYPGNANIPCTRDIRTKSDAEAWDVLESARALVDRVFPREPLLDLVPSPRAPSLRDLDLNSFYVSESGEAFIQFEKDSKPVAATDIYGQELSGLGKLLGRRDPEETGFVLKHDMFRYVCTKFDAEGGKWHHLRRMHEEFFPSWLETSVVELSYPAPTTARVR
jgi:hypothetical protein